MFTAQLVSGYPGVGMVWPIGISDALCQKDSNWKSDMPSHSARHALQECAQIDYIQKGSLRDLVAELSLSFSGSRAIRYAHLALLNPTTVAGIRNSSKSNYQFADLI